MSLDYTEDTLVEQPAIALFAELGWETMNCFDEVFDLRDAPTGRLYMGWETSIEVQTRLQCYQSIIQVWALSTGQPLSKSMIDKQHDWIRALAFYPDGSRLASGGYDGTLLVWDFTKGTLISESSTRFPGGITSLAIRPDGELLAVGGTSRLLWLWDASNFQPIGDKFPAGGLIPQLDFRSMASCSIPAIRAERY